MLFKLQVCKSFLLLFLLSVTLSFAHKHLTDSEVKENEAIQQKLSVANNYLALNLYKKISNGQSGNIFFSPLSLSMGFGMLFQGARGRTLKVLREALGYEAAGLSSEEVSRLFYQLLEEDIFSLKNPVYKLYIANKVLVQKSLHLKLEYKKEIKDFFNAFVDEVDFVKDSEKIKGIVNHWVEAQTHGKIKELLEKVDAGTVLLLLNAIYFKGIWKTKFDSKETSEQVFYNYGVEANAKKVKTMHLTNTFNYTSTDDAQVLELPYKGSDISMVILLPKELNGLSAIEQSLTSKKMASIRKKFNSEKVVLSLPKFEIKFSREMSNDFKSLGAAEAFDSTKADFSGIADNSTYVTQVIHKAAIEINEEGSEASAATGIGMAIRILPQPPSGPIEFKADHPFIFTILDNRNDIILFAGRVNLL